MLYVQSYGEDVSHSFLHFMLIWFLFSDAVFSARDVSVLAGAAGC